MTLVGAECIGRFFMNPDDLERIPVGAKCVGRFFMNPDDLVGRFFHDLEFCILDFEFRMTLSCMNSKSATCPMKIFGRKHASL